MCVICVRIDSVEANRKKIKKQNRTETKFLVKLKQKEVALVKCTGKSKDNLFGKKSENIRPFLEAHQRHFVLFALIADNNNLLISIIIDSSEHEEENKIFHSMTQTQNTDL